jgi:hypothetical protein
MPRIVLVRLFSIAVFAGAAAAPCYPQQSQRPTNFVIDTNRAFVYLRFDHVGKGPKRWDAEPELRIWLRFVNNCNVPIELSTYGTPEGGPTEEVGVMDEVVENPRPRIEITSGPPIETTSVDSAVPGSQPPSGQAEPNTRPEAANEPEEMPTDYWFELGSWMTVQPGKEVLFSIPVNHLGKKWHVEIPFEFKDAGGKFPRDPMNGGQPQMRLLYSLYDLPDQARAEIVGKTTK